MNRFKLTGFLFVLLGVLVILGSAYAIISYASDLMTAIVDFVTTHDFTKLQQCGVTPPPQFQKLKAELATVILPSLYIGLPLLLIILSFLMFLGGFYYHKGRHEEEAKKYETMEREMLRKAVTKVEAGKTSTSLGPPPPPVAEEEPQEEEAEEPEEEEPPQPRRTKRKR